jgi:hypothetical protein
MNMDYREIREVMNKYWRGESTLEEEKQLKNFFHGHPEVLPQELEQVRDLFGFFEKESLVATDAISLPEKGRLKIKKPLAHRERYLLKSYWEYAAIFLFLLASVLLFNPKNRNEKSAAAMITDTYQNPQQAFDATQKALALLAANLNKGKDEMQKLAVFNQAEEVVRNGK